MPVAFQTRRSNIKSPAQNHSAPGGIDTDARQFLRKNHAETLVARYRDRYAHADAYREDTWRWSNGDIFHDILALCAPALTRCEGCGYWQRNKRMGECLAA